MRNTQTSPFGIVTGRIPVTNTSTDLNFLTSPETERGLITLIKYTLNFLSILGD